MADLPKDVAHGSAKSPAEQPPLMTGAAATALGGLYVSISQALANAAHNAVAAQQQASVTAQAANVAGLSTLYSIDTAAVGVATRNVLGGE
ncbi:MAG: RebB family R body protein [Caulobacteraceae bacterium]